MVVIIAVATLSLTGFLVKSFSSRSLHAIDARKMERQREEKNIAALNSLSRYKALVSPSKRSGGEYIPVLFAKNYYDKNWAMIATQPIGGIAARKGGRVTFRQRKQLLKSQEIAALMSSGQFQAPEENVSVRLVKPNFDSSGRVVQSLDVVGALNLP